MRSGISYGSAYAVATHETTKMRSAARIWRYGSESADAASVTISFRPITSASHATTMPARSVEYPAKRKPMRVRTSTAAYFAWARRSQTQRGDVHGRAPVAGSGRPRQTTGVFMAVAKATVAGMPAAYTSAAAHATSSIARCPPS